MIERKFVLSFVAWMLILTGSWIPANADQIQIITELGNVFTATTDSSQQNNGFGTGNGRAMIDGMGINSRIINRDFVGKLNYGYGVSGPQSSLKTYNLVPSLTDFAAQLLDTDPKTSLIIPKFNTEYQYQSSTQLLQETSATAPNILGYLQSRTVGGSAVSTLDSEGITISGTGTVILKLNSLGAQTLVLEGNVPNGAMLQIGTDPKYDYLTIPYQQTHGFQLWSGKTDLSAERICGGRGRSFWCGNNWFAQQSFSPPLVTSSRNNLYDTYFGLNSITGIQNPDNTYSVTSERVFLGMVCDSRRCSGGMRLVPSPTTHYIYDREMIFANKFELSNVFQTPYNFEAAKQYYIIAKPNGGTITIKGSVIDPLTTPYLKITNLPPNIPFEILKDGFVASKGMSQYDGTVTLLINDVSIGGTSPNGIMHLYPDSLKYRGPFSTIVFDNVNNQVIHIPTLDDKVYVAHAYVQIPVVGNVTITDTYLDNQLALSYLNGNYTTGNHIKVPVIPGYYDINMKINGVPTTTVISNVLGGTGLKVIPPSTSTITDYDDNNLISTISATSGTTAYVISTTAGTITTSITATISGNSEIENYAYFGATPPAPPPPPPRDPLKAFVDIYRNGVFASQQQIYFNPNPTVQNSAGVSGSSSYLVDKYTYPQTVINGVITTNVVPGDMIEFYLYANISADGSAPPVPSGYIFYHYSGEGHATATIHSGSILTGM